MKLQLLAFCFAAWTACVVKAAEWSYAGEDGPSHWKDHYEKCGLSSQSPIDITGAQYKNLASFSFTGYNTAPSGMTLSNNGHTAVVNVDGNLQVTNGGLPDTYKVAQFHFHWGSDDTKGSEHLVNGKQYPLEMHIVHFSTKYDTAGDAIDKKEGLAVLGVFFEISNTDNQTMDEVVDNLQRVLYAKQEFELEAFPLENLLPNNKDDFFRYNGSLTTPPCYESVVWTVFRETVKISEDQLANFRKINEAGSTSGNPTPMVNNFRPIMDLNGRTILATFEGSAAPSIATRQNTFLALLAALSLMFVL